MALIFSVVNQKGGVGKTTVTTNLGAGLALKGFKILVIDLDIQCNLSHTLVGDVGENENICNVLLNGVKIEKIIRDTSIEKLKIAPAGHNLCEADLSLAPKMGREMALRKSLNSDALNSFDFVLVDNPPYLSLLTINSLVASNYIIVPVSCELYPLLGLKYLLRTLNSVIEDLNPKLEILGYVLTMYDKRESVTLQTEELMKKRFGEKLFESRIRINTMIKGAQLNQKTIFEYDKLKAKGSEDFVNLTLEFLKRVEHGKN